MKPMATKTSPLSERETRSRLLNAAGEVFAEKGFKAATVREICQRAGANVAAINYHFGDKQKLYADVLRLSHTCAMERHPSDQGLSDRSTPEERLRAFIHSFVHRVFDDGQPAWQGKLMSREMVEPTRALDYLIRHEIGPRRDQLNQTLRQIVGRGASEKLLRHCTQSIVGQCAFYHHARPMIERLYPQQKFDAGGVRERAESIYQFTLAALRGLAAERGGKS
jgi:TetR/AcrR family transcriptional regulator, regulator of cefoperazone and chloramphenicol sensitivity